MRPERRGGVPLAVLAGAGARAPTKVLTGRKKDGIGGGNPREEMWVRDGLETN